MPRFRPRYNPQGWPLGQCSQCGRCNYVEPHGMTAACACSPDWTEHASISWDDTVTTFRGEYVNVTAVIGKWRATHPQPGPSAGN